MAHQFRANVALIASLPDGGRDVAGGGACWGTGALAPDVLVLMVASSSSEAPAGQDLVCGPWHARRGFADIYHDAGLSCPEDRTVRHDD